MQRTRTPEDILVHRFLLKVAQNAAPAVHQIIDWLTVGRKRRTNPPRLTPRQSYQAAVFWGACRLSHIPREIKACEVFIVNTPSNSYLNRLGFGQKDYIHNQYYASLMLMESSHDWALRLCHSVFNLGEPRVESPVGNEWMERTGVSYKLERLASQADAVREIKQGIVTPTMIRKVSIITEPFLKSCLNLGPARADPISSFNKKPILSDTVSPADISKLVRHVSEQRSELTTTIDELLDDLLPVYEKWTQVFSTVKY